MYNLELRLQQLIKECEQLKLENRKLKTILKHHNIPLNSSIQNTKTESMKIKEQKINERIKIYKNLFIGRTDVYAVRWEAKSGKSGYTSACKHEWKPDICQKPNIKCSECQYRELLPLTDQVIYDHLTGKHIIGLYPLLQNETCWFLAVDFDKKNWQIDVKTFIETCKELNVPANVERSRSGNGCHVWIFFQEALPAYLVRKLGNELISKTLEKRYELGMDSFDRLFPNQDTLPKGGFGNLIALPLQNGPRKNGNTVFVDENFIPFLDQWLYLNNVKKMTLEEVKAIIDKSYPSNKSSTSENETKLYLNKESQNFPIKLKVIIRNSLLIDKEGLPSSFIHKLIKLATFKNPEFFKAQAKRLSTYGIPRNIICSEETDRLIILPRGCKDDLEELLIHNAIKYEFQELSNIGTKIDLKFKGKLRTEQDQAVKKLLENPIGILSATTEFGKTVIAASISSNILSPK